MMADFSVCSAVTWRSGFFICLFMVV